MSKSFFYAIIWIGILLIPASLLGQQKTILVYDLQLGTVDSLPRIDFDPTITNDRTNHFIGHYDANTQYLQQEVPTINTFEESNFTFKSKVSDSLNVDYYPVRTTVKIFEIKNDTLFDNCTGSLISNRHVLTAAHCVSQIFTNNISVDSLRVFPAFDNGKESEKFGSSAVTKVFFAKDREWFDEDFAILELKRRLGHQTGWLGLGFNEDGQTFEEDIYYKFSYPGITIPRIDPREFNGDTLFYGYGEIKAPRAKLIVAEGVTAIPGESGSPIIKVINDEEYTNYGVLVTTNSLRHSRLSDWLFYAFKDIIEEDFVLGAQDTELAYIYVHPNPVKDGLFIHFPNDLLLRGIRIINNLGVLITQIDPDRIENAIDVRNLPNGIYYLQMTTKSAVKTIRFVKE